MNRDDNPGIRWNPFRALAVIVGLEAPDTAAVVVAVPPYEYTPPNLRGNSDESTTVFVDFDSNDSGTTVDGAAPPLTTVSDDDDDAANFPEASAPPPLSAQATTTLADAYGITPDEAHAALSDPANFDADGERSIVLAGAALRQQLFGFRSDEWRWRMPPGVEEDAAAEGGGFWDPLGLRAALMKRVAPAAAAAEADEAQRRDPDLEDPRTQWHVLDAQVSAALSAALKQRRLTVNLPSLDIGACTALLRQMVLHRERDGAMLELEIAGEPRLAMTPPHWQPQLEDEATLVEVPQRSAEWRWAAAAMQLRCPDMTILCVERVQDVNLWERYIMQRDQRARANGGDANERWLFHGPKSTPPRAIWHDGDVGFDGRMSNSGYFGTGGAYFSESSMYSDAGYAFRCPSYHSDGAKQMFLASVICGVSKDYGRARDSSLKRPPPQPGTSGRLFDSINSAPDQVDYRMHVVWNNAQAYPRYIVTYSTPPSHRAKPKQRSKSAARALTELHCDATLIRAGLPPPPPKLLAWTAAADPPSSETEAADGMVATNDGESGGSGASPRARWEWEDGASGSGKWQPYPALVCDQLDAGLHRCRAQALHEVEIAIGGKYRVFIDSTAVSTNMYQMNTSSGFTRDVRCNGDRSNRGLVSALPAIVVAVSGAATKVSSPATKVSLPPSSPPTLAVGAVPARGSGSFVGLPLVPPTGSTAITHVAHALREACLAGRTKAVKQILTTHPETVVEADANGNTALLCAMMGRTVRSNFTTAKLIVESSLTSAQAQDAVVNAQDATGRTALLFAASIGSVEMVRVLFTHGADENLSDALGHAPVHAAAENGHAATITALLASGAKPGVTTNDGSSVLLLAANNGHTDVINALWPARRDLDVEAADDQGVTPLIAAASAGHHATAKLLVSDQWYAALDCTERSSLAQQSSALGPMSYGSSSQPLQRTARNAARANGHYLLEKMLIDTALEQQRHRAWRCPSCAECAAMPKSACRAQAWACYRSFSLDYAWWGFAVCIRPFAVVVTHARLLCVTFSFIFCAIPLLVVGLLLLLMGPGGWCMLLMGFLMWSSSVGQACCLGVIWCDFCCFWPCRPIHAQTHSSDFCYYCARRDARENEISHGCGQIEPPYFDEHGVCRKLRPDVCCCPPCMEDDAEILPWRGIPTPPPSPRAVVASANTASTANGDDDAVCTVQ